MSLDCSTTISQSLGSNRLVPVASRTVSIDMGTVLEYTWGVDQEDWLAE